MLRVRWRRKHDTRGSSVAPYHDCRTSYLGNHTRTDECQKLSYEYGIRFYKVSDVILQIKGMPILL
jgi:hypothetical protein